MTIPWQMHQDESGGVPTVAPRVPQPVQAVAPRAVAPGDDYGVGMPLALSPDEDAKPSSGSITVGYLALENLPFFVSWSNDYGDAAGFEEFDSLDEALELINELEADQPGEYNFTLVQGRELALKKSGYIIDESQN